MGYPDWIARSEGNKKGPAEAARAKAGRLVNRELLSPGERTAPFYRPANCGPSTRSSTLMTARELPTYRTITLPAR